MLHIVARLGADFDRDARVAAADAEIGILHDDGQGVAGRLPLLRFLAEAADRAQRFQLGEKALLDAIDLGEVVERLVGEFRIGRVFQHGKEDAARALVVILAEGEDSEEEVRADRDRRHRVFR